MHDERIEHFFDEGLITDIERQLSSGKEAEVFLCRANPSTTGERLAALKLYRPREKRDFRDFSTYTPGRYDGMLPSVRRGIARKGRFGQQAEYELWIGAEWEMLRHLHGAGVPVPRPIASAEGAVLMSYIGDEGSEAPQLRDYRPDPEETAEFFRLTIRAVELMLAVNVIHADLSPYNLLVWEGELVVIDVPQAIDPRKHPNAFDLLSRDVRNVCSWFERRGVQADSDGLAQDLWTAWTFADLIPGDMSG